MRSVRTAVPGDWAAIWRIMEPVVRAGETYCWDPGMDQKAARSEWLPEAPLDTTLCVYVAVDDGVVVGTVQLHANRGGNGNHVANASFLVAGDAGGKGIARHLADHVMTEARGQGYESMQFNAVVQTNERAVALWRSLEFEVIGTVPGAFRHPVQGPTGLHIMFRRL
ncbi:GNAT family N-acetyltransferase [Arthrobacter sp. Br18]|uniref:GNAT family N-acetyltransferase n=1 Tax=Arthrobacter sp. Br18 TaxID=1312954 RepID=UPI001567C58E|nr:GNAT family N-acetyltransferase [Arthrobacter sp. Br18]